MTSLGNVGVVNHLSTNSIVGNREEKVDFINVKRLNQIDVGDSSLNLSKINFKNQSNQNRYFIGLSNDHFVIKDTINDFSVLKADKNTQQVTIPGLARTSDVYSRSYIDSSLNLKADASDIPTDFYSRSYVDSSLNLKANTSDIPTDFYSTSYVDNSLNLKANTSSVYSRSYIDNSLNLKANASSVYSRSYIDNSLNLKANASDIPTDFYSQSYIDNSLNLKANASDIPTDFYNTSHIDLSFDSVTERLDTLDTSVNNIVIPTDFYNTSHIDASFDSVTERLDTLDTSVNNIVIPTDFYSQSHIDASFGNVTQRLDTLDTSVNNIVIPTDFYSTSYVDNSLNLKANASDIPTDFYSQSYIDASFDDVTQRLDTLDTSVNNIVIPTDFYSQSHIDTSFNNVTERLDTLDTSVNNIVIPTDFYSTSYVDNSLNLKANTSDIPTDFYSTSHIDTSFGDVTQRLDTLDTSVNNIVIPTDFYSQSYVDNSLNLKANISDIPTDFYSQSYVDNSLNLKANVSDIPTDFYSTSHIDTSFSDVTQRLDTLDTSVNNIVIPTDFYSTSHIDTSFNNVTERLDTLDTSVNSIVIPTDFYSQSYVDNSLNLKANTSDIPTDFYSTSYVDNSLNLKANTSDIPTDFYSTSHIDTSFGDVTQRLDTLDTSVNNIVIPTDFYSQSYIDNSFNSVSSRLNTLDTSVNDITTSLTSANVKIGEDSGVTNFGSRSIAVGLGALKYGVQNQNDIIALGAYSANSGAKYGVISIGKYSSINASEDYSISIGVSANNQSSGAGENSIAIGFQAQTPNQNSILLNATGNALSTSNSNAFYVKPIRSNSTSNSLFYNSTTGEITYGSSSSSSSYSQTYIDNSFADVYTKSYIDNSFNNVTQRLDTLDTSVNNIVIPTDFYSQAYIDNSFNSLSGIGKVTGISLTNTYNQYSYNNPPSGTTSTQTYNVTGGGTGLTVYFTVTINNLIDPSTLVIVDGGQGYSVGDQVRILQYGTTAQNGSQAYANITSVQQGLFHTQTYIDNSLNLKANTSSPTFTGQVFLDTTGQNSTNKYGLIVGDNCGNVAINVNDGEGNANITFNHHWKRTDSSDTSQSAGRISCGVDSPSATMLFKLKSNTSVNGSPTLTEVLRLLETEIQCKKNTTITGNLTVSGTIINTTLDTRLNGFDTSFNDVYSKLGAPPTVQHKSRTDYGAASGSSLIYGLNDYEFIGNSVAMSDDGTLLITGGAEDEAGGDGRARVYDLSYTAGPGGANPHWAQRGPTINGISNSKFGECVDITGDGSRIVIGAGAEFRYSAGSSSTGHLQQPGYFEVYDYNSSNNTYTLVGSRVIPKNVNNSLWGQQVAISKNGTRVVVSSPTHNWGNGSYGGFILYELINNTWTELGHIKGLQSYTQFGGYRGRALAISDDGSRVVVGISRYDATPSDSSTSYHGRVEIWQYNSSTGTTTRGSNFDLLHSVDGNNLDQLAHSATISGDGKVVAYGVHGWSNNSKVGKVEVLREQITGNTATWVIKGDNNDPIITATDGVGDGGLFTGFGNNNFGYANLDLSQDGNVIATYALGANKVLCFQYIASLDKWEDMDAFDAYNNETDSRYGYGLALTRDGTKLAIGAPHNTTSNYRGLVQTFDITNLYVAPGRLYHTGNYQVRVMP